MRALRDNRTIPLTIIVLSVFFAGWSVAGAHTASSYYPATWASDQPVIQQSTGNLPASSFQSATTYARGEWNAVSGAWFDMSYGGTSGANPVYAACSQPTTDIYTFAWQWDGAGGVLAQGHFCYSGSTISRARVFLDTLDGWYLGSGSPGGLYDGRSVLTHELGHAGGIGGTHFSGSDCSGTIQTMCPTIGAGTTWARTLESHDEHTFASAY